MGNSEPNYFPRLEEMTIAMLEASPQLQWHKWWKLKARAIEQWNRDRGINISHDHFLGDGKYAEPQMQFEFDNHISALCYLAALNAWDKVEIISIIITITLVIHNVSLMAIVGSESFKSTPPQINIHWFFFKDWFQL